MKVMSNMIRLPETITVKYFDDSIDKLIQTENGDLIDVRSRIDIELKAGCDYKIPLGIAMKLPKGYKANLYPRSSTFKNYGILLVNSVGQIDNSYSGDNDEWIMHVYATRDAVIHKNDRIGQFEIVPVQPPIIFNEVDRLDGPDRGGFGSTGIQ